MQGIDGGAASVSGLYRYSVVAQGQPTQYAPMPKTLRLRQGQSLQVALSNDVPCPPAGRESEAHINIHTHGLLVAPREPGTATGASFGDYSGVTVTRSGCAQGTTTHAMHDPQAHRANRAQYVMQIPPDHPSGLYWYHPHIHGVAGLQIGGGASGLIEIGELFDYAYFNCSLKPHPGSGHRKCASAAERAKELAKQNNTDQVLIALKDHQLKRSGLANEWLFPAAGPDDKFDPGLCNRFTSSGAAWPNAQCSNTGGTATWAFTLNNQVFPTITVPVKNGVAGGKVLRIANVSANVTHKLRMRVALPNGSLANLSYQLLARDGMSIDQGATVKESVSVAMMPASRAEIYVSHDDICQAMGQAAGCAHERVDGVLETEGMETGDTVGGADTWPAIQLAKIVFPRITQAGTASAMLVAANRFEDASLPSAAPARPARSAAASLATGQASVCDSDTTAGLPPAVLTSNQYRLIGFQIGDEAVTANPFFLAAEVHNLSDDMRSTMPSTVTYKAFDPAVKAPSVCVGTPLAQGGVQETWVIVNQSSELHNFHIHQLKFKVEEVLTIGNSPAGQQPISVRAGGHHDTFPINPGGRIKISIRFDRQEQLGRYFFHCHILEHEDKGMMARVQVIDTSAPPVAARRTSGAKAVARSAPSATTQAMRPSANALLAVSTTSAVSMPMRITARNRMPTIRDSQGREIPLDICTTPKSL
jgi:FtsP/CotA-like multicopper oxidase with cupredoxin domain